MLTLSNVTRSVQMPSEADGSFRIGMTHAPFNIDLALSASKPGFKPYEYHFQSRDHLRNVVITMEKEVGR